MRGSGKRLAYVKTINNFFVVYTLTRNKMMTYRLRFFQVLILPAWLAGFASPAALAVDDKPPAKQEDKPEKKADALKKYADVISKDAKSSQGVFAVHRVEDKVYFEIPPDALSKLMLWQAEVAKSSNTVASSLGSRVVRWERRGNKIYLWEMSFDKHSNGDAVKQAVASMTMGSILFSFNVEAEGRDRAAVINVTPFYTGELPEFSAKRLAGAGASLDGARCYVDEVKSFPTNIETRSLLTFRPGGNGSSTSVLVHYSMTLLPERPMEGRFFDTRVGYFTESFEDYSSAKNWVERKQFISRYHLEKKDRKAEVSEPVKPIVFYIGREVPEKWREYVKAGVEDWQPVFEKAGFKNAIVCKNAPAAGEEDSWDAEDARYSVIRWVAQPIMNAMGPHVHDPRSGEIISAHVIIWHDVLKLIQHWYFVQCGAVDPAAQKLPLSDELTGKLLRYVVTHEVGHALGLRHNHRATSAYTIAQLRDPKFCEEHGTTASIMSYGRNNYVAQPEDKVKWLMPKVGPYDYFAISWGYKPIPNANSPEAERTELDRWAARQMDEPWLRFGGEDSAAMSDPTVKAENIGDDAIEATKLGLKNLDRATDLLVSATERLGEDESLLKEIYQEFVSHRANWFSSVARLIGGVVETRSLGGRGGESFTRVSKEKQQKAIQFLLDNAFTTPKKLLAPAIVNRFKHFGVADEVTSQQRMLLMSLLSSRRFHQLMDAEVLDADKAYTAKEFLTDVQNGVWRELKDGHPEIDACRRALQRAYLEQLKKEINPKDKAAGSVQGDRETDYHAVALAALKDLAQRLDAAIQQTKNSMVLAHLQDCRREVDLILNPRS
jgi:hypothetical protein